MFGKSVLASTKHVGGFWMFGEFVSTSINVRSPF